MDANEIDNPPLIMIPILQSDKFKIQIVPFGVDDRSITVISVSSGRIVQTSWQGAIPRCDRSPQ